MSCGIFQLTQFKVIVPFIPCTLSPCLGGIICSNIHDGVSKWLHGEYHVYFVHRHIVGGEKVLEDRELQCVFTVGEYPCPIVELDLSYKEFLVEGDASEGLSQSRVFSWNITKCAGKRKSICVCYKRKLKSRLT